MPQKWTLAGLAYLSVIVSLSWFGVNLLGIGLHSYGFTDFMIWSLAVFVTIETAIIFALIYRKENIGIKKTKRANER